MKIAFGVLLGATAAAVIYTLIFGCSLSTFVDEIDAGLDRVEERQRQIDARRGR
jgi:hypothetical protein